MQLVLSMGLAILVGQLSEYFVSERTEEQTRNAYLFALGLTLSILLSAFVHNHGFLQAQEIGELVPCRKWEIHNFMAFVTPQFTIVSQSLSGTPLGG